MSSRVSPEVVRVFVVDGSDYDPERRSRASVKIDVSDADLIARLNDAMVLDETQDPECALMMSPAVTLVLLGAD